MNTAKGKPDRGGVRSLRTRFRLLQVGLFLPVVVTAVLSAAYLRALRSRQRAVEAAGQQMAKRTAELALVQATRLGDSAARAILDPARRVRRATPARILGAMQGATDSLRVCRCGPLKEGAYLFVWVPATGELSTSVPIDRGIDPRLRLPRVKPSFSRRGSSEIWAESGRDSSGQWLLHYTGVELADGGEAIAGMDISMASWWSSTFAPALESVRRQLFPMFPDSVAVFSAELRAQGVGVAGTTEQYSGPSARTAVLGGAIFSLDIALNPGSLPLLLSAAAVPSYPLLLGALGASVLVSVLALLLLRQLRETMARREAFVASISHELRTPLTELLLQGESLQLDRQTPESKRRAAGAIVRETRRLIGLVENALTLAGAGRSPAPTGPAILPAPVLRATLQTLQPAGFNHRASFDLELDDSVGCAIDPVALDRIATNLVENALRYGPVGQTIKVRLRAGVGSLQFTVADQGPGVPPAERFRIWEPFERGSAAKNNRDTGVGLGLAIVKELTEAAGGRVTVTNSPGGGAEFVVILPSASIDQSLPAG